MKKQFDGRVALVTGAGGGIGRATARAFARKGAEVAVADISFIGGEETLSLIKENGGKAIFLKADVSLAEDVEELVSKTIEAYGRLDYACNNAGIEGDTALTADCTEENWDRTVDLNLKGVWMCMKHEIPHMIEQGGGAIVNISSMMGVIGHSNGLPAYIASKHGVLGLTKSAALEYAGSGIRVNAVCPGIIHTNIIDRMISQMPDVLDALNAQTPLGRIGKPEEIAGAVVWLCSDAASFITGQPLIVDGGFTAQ